MSKAFTSESDADDQELAIDIELPPGTRNYMTPAGVERFESERSRLLEERATLEGESFDAKRRRQVIDRRLRFLNSRLQSAIVVDPARQPQDVAQFGARVTVQEPKGEPERWRIVGIDEMDLHCGDISWSSPLAAALLQSRVGDIVRFQNRTLKVLSIDYPV